MLNCICQSETLKLAMEREEKLERDESMTLIVHMREEKWELKNRLL